MDLHYHITRTQGDTRYQIAYATSDFWKEWRGNSAALGAIGIVVFQERDDQGKVHWMVSRTSTISKGQLPEPKPTPPFIMRDKKQLFSYQIKPTGAIVAALLAHRVAIDASDTGTGKTYTSLKACKILGLKPVIVCTKTGIRQWKKACKFYGLKPGFVYNWESCLSIRKHYIF